MQEYPETVLEFRERFATEEACRAYLEALRWPHGFVCPQCKGKQAWVMRRGLSYVFKQGSQVTLCFAAAPHKPKWEDRVFLGAFYGTTNDWPWLTAEQPLDKTTGAAKGNEQGK